MAIPAVTPDCYTSAQVDSRYLDRKLSGLCTRGSCKEQAVDGEQLCGKHKTAELERKRSHDKRIRAVRRANGMCAMCGARKSKTYRCAACELRFQQSPARKAISATSAVSSAATLTRLDRIAAATRDHTEPATAGSRGGVHQRYHGKQSRGPQTTAVLDEQDLTDAINRFTKAREELRLVRSPEWDKYPRSERKAAERSALSHVDHAMRFGEEVLTRNRYHEQTDRMVPG